MHMHKLHIDRYNINYGSATYNSSVVAYRTLQRIEYAYSYQSVNYSDREQNRKNCKTCQSHSIIPKKSTLN